MCRMCSTKRIRQNDRRGHNPETTESNQRYKSGRGLSPKLSIMRIITCKITSFVIYKTGWRLKFGVPFLWYLVSLRESARVYHKFSTRFKNMHRTFVPTFPRNCMGGLDIKALPLNTMLMSVPL